eukprot:gnl/TRDRNA2_/TRDRNA2_89233_c0_seq1.p1 gnl/TRDRNA2_/TRDRNA2_89233_c0~~gnl/TRDRNA2_/TRDRNA2_89233_c0_seq1.p1  ORF type:complete len:435 (-),score=77.96 gnl/TRDRNA2_/TRDRNA2_89233_c0_seq1:54-1358(-)
MSLPLRGKLIPYGDPGWYSGTLLSPYYKLAHAAWRDKCHKFVEDELMPEAADWDEAAMADDAFGGPGQVNPAVLTAKFADAGLLPSVFGEWPSAYTDVPRPEGYDLFFSQICIDEVCRTGTGVGSIILTGYIIGGRPILSFGSEATKRKFLPDLLSGRKNICLGMSEPYAGSDVASLRASAVREGDEFVLNGEKKWITGGIFADLITVACKTDKGMTLMVVDLASPGVGRRKMKCSGIWASGTTFVTFDNVRVPASNVLAEEGQAFKYLMKNLNHERWFVAVWALRCARNCMEDAVNWAETRKTFGKTLISHQAISMKLAGMASALETTQAFVDQMTFNMITMDSNLQPDLLGGPSAILKTQACKALEMVAREASQVMGGNSYIRGGPGERIERAWRETRAFTIFAGSEEVMLDLAGKQMHKRYMATRELAAKL